MVRLEDDPGYLGEHLGAPVFHDLSSLRTMLDLFLRGEPAAVALGPLYREDPAAEFLAPFRASAAASRWPIRDERELAPDWALRKAADLRRAALPQEGDLVSLVEWSRAGAVLELGSRWGILVLGRGLLHPIPKMLGSVTGRFGYEGASLPDGGKWNPLTIPEAERDRVIPSVPSRSLAVIDFRGMDLCSMLGIVPGLIDYYDPAEDLHGQTANYVCAGRDVAKRELFVHAYGGESELRSIFERELPPLDFLRKMPPGEAGRAVQRQSAVTFRAALSEALPLLVHSACRPLFAVHDEIVLDVAGGAERWPQEVLKAMERGASERTGVHHSARLKAGRSYMEAKWPG